MTTTTLVPFLDEHVHPKMAPRLLLSPIIILLMLERGPIVVVRNSNEGVISSFNLCRSSFFHLHNISSIRRVLDMKTTGIIVQALVISPLDNCNFLLCGLPAILIKRLQKIQNAAARVIAKACRRDHISPILFKHIVLYMASPQLTSKSC